MKLRSAADDLLNAKAFATTVIDQDGAPPQITPSYCSQCGTGLMLLERAARLCRCSPRVLYRWIEQGQLHFCELADGTVMVCGRTLAEQVNEIGVCCGTVVRRSGLSANLFDEPNSLTIVASQFAPHRRSTSGQSRQVT